MTRPRTPDHVRQAVEADLAAGLGVNAVARKHGVSAMTATRLRRAWWARQADQGGLNGPAHRALAAALRQADPA